MPIRFTLDFTAPFQVGDDVYLAYPPNQKAVTGSVAEIRPLKATVSAVKVSFGLTEELIVSQPLAHYPVQVRHVMYTLIPAPPHQFSPFTVSCSALDDKPILFATEDAFVSQEAV